MCDIKKWWCDFWEQPRTNIDDVERWRGEKVWGRKFSPSTDVGIESEREKGKSLKAQIAIPFVRLASIELWMLGILIWYFYISIYLSISAEKPRYTEMDLWWAGRAGKVSQSNHLSASAENRARYFSQQSGGWGFSGEIFKIFYFCHCRPLPSLFKRKAPVYRISSPVEILILRWAKWENIRQIRGRR